ncbi:MAG TPA: heterodisulfide reductase-related iron-sulfur binding cluster [Candidatus Acidoferrum sp.]|nr:heterodisulfide reductase-related iron-sulfur binding cluster [Candidatus Acidoferrum sp.]
MTEPIPYRATAAVSYDPAEPVYWAPDALEQELRRTFEICHGCRLCFKFCDTFPSLFALIDAREGDVRAVTSPDAERVLDTCFQCKLCDLNCPYTVRDHHPYQMDFPKLVHRQRAVRARARRPSLRDRILGSPDLTARFARASFGLANVMNRLRPHRWLLEKLLGIHRDKRLPRFAATTFEAWARRAGRMAKSAGGDVVLFQTCYVQNNAPEIGRDTLAVLDANRVDARCAAGLSCCGMPAWEKGDLAAVQAAAAKNLKILEPFAAAGAKVVAINPTCSMMLRREYPTLVAQADRPAAARVAAATMDPSEYLWSIREEPRFNTAFRSAPDGPVAYHAPCHLRAQAVGYRARDLLRRIPGVTPVLVTECSGHDGTFAMTKEGFEPSRRIGGKAFEGMRSAGASVWVTDCPLAALQFAQHAGVEPLHPMTLLARAYRDDGFPRKLEIE